MTALVIDTSTQRLLLGIQTPEQSQLLYQQASDGNHASDILERIQILVSGLRVERIGVALGPGSFTGLRIGLSIAKGLAEGWGCPLFGLDNLGAMARTFDGLYPMSASAVLSVIDARKKRFYGSLTLRGKVLIPVADWSPRQWYEGIKDVWKGPTAISGFQGDLLAAQWGTLPEQWEVLPLQDWTRELLVELCGKPEELALEPGSGPVYGRLSEAEELRFARERGSDVPPDRAD